MPLYITPNGELSGSPSLFLKKRSHPQDDPHQHTNSIPKSTESRLLYAITRNDKISFIKTLDDLNVSPNKELRNNAWQSLGGKDPLYSP